MRRRTAATLVALGALTLGLSAGPASAGSAPRAHTAIVGGTPAVAGTFPSLAYVFDNLGNGFAAACTGTVVAANVILTAGHCVTDLATDTPEPAKGYAVVTGSLNRTDAAARQVSAVTQVLAFPGFDPATGYGDAGLLVLATPTTAPAIPLASAADLNLIQAGDAIAIAGWGETIGGDPSSTTNALQWGIIGTQSPAYCAANDGNDGLLFDPASEFCAIDPNNMAISACHGDSGGPALAAPTPSSLVEVGIISRSDPYCDPTVPDILTRVDLVSPWVAQEIAAVAPPPPATPAPAPVTPTPAPITTAATAPASPNAGSYSGRSSQHLGHLSLILTSAGITQLNLRYNLHCPHGRRGPYTRTATWPTTALALTATNGTWGFTTSYHDTAPWHYTITGSFTSATTAAGTLAVTTHNGRCRTGTVHWTASLPAT